MWWRRQQPRVNGQAGSHNEAKIVSWVSHFLSITRMFSGFGCHEIIIWSQCTLPLTLVLASPRAYSSCRIFPSKTNYGCLCGRNYGRISGRTKYCWSHAAGLISLYLISYKMLPHCKNIFNDYEGEEGREGSGREAPSSVTTPAPPPPAIKASYVFIF